MLLLTAPVSAHPGRTDASGGHYNHSTGEYHYHHGYPEHQHPGGQCPYNFDDQTNHSSGSSKSERDSSRNGSSGLDESSESDHSPFDVPIEALWVLLAIYALLTVALVRFFQKKKQRAKQEQEREEQRQQQLREQQERQRLIREERERQQRLREERERQWQLRQEERRQKLLLEEQERQRIFMERRAQVEALYGGKRLSDLCPPPNPKDHIGEDGLPCGPGPGRWGKDYTVYITSKKSPVFHCQEICSNAHGTAVNIASIRDKRPCARCTPSLPSLDWYWKQLKILRLCKKYNVALAPESDFSE